MSRFEEVRRGAFVGHRRVAIEVLLRALEDFDAKDTWAARAPRHPRKRLHRLRLRIRAGEFLLERSDAIVHHWFELAGFSLTGTRFLWRQEPPANHFDRLAQIRAEADDLRRQLYPEKLAC